MILSRSVALLSSIALLALADAQGEYVAGYLIIPNGERVEKRYDAGFSMYVAAWPLQHTYAGHQFQTGLPGTWMFAQYDDKPPKDMYSDVEGGLGWWRDTRFPTTTPKFVMGGVGPNFEEIANGPSHGAGTWDDPKGLYGVAQLSNSLLFPMDGLDIKQGTCGQFVGYGYLSLPLIDPTPESANHCWTLFLSTSNFKGPVAFFTPYFWSHFGKKDPKLAGLLLDTRPEDPNQAIQMETQYIPCRIAKDGRGVSYARIAPTAYPLNEKGESALLQQSMAYDSTALYDQVKSWFAGGSSTTGAVNVQGSFPRTYGEGGYSTWEIRVPDGNGKEATVLLDWKAFAKPTVFDPQTYGMTWNQGSPIRPAKDRVDIPQYFVLQGSDKKQNWAPVPDSQVPTETGLQKITWDTPKEDPQQPFTTPDDAGSVWKSPGPKAGPFKVKLGDGTTVTYSWYRFADQPAILNAGLSDAQREELQRRVEKIHRKWKRTGTYLAPPKTGTLAALDPAQIVKPPRGLEIGYVPIATRQG